MKQFRERDDPCRRALIQALVGGIFSSAGGATAQNVVDPALQEPPAGQSAYHVSAVVIATQPVSSVSKTALRFVAGTVLSVIDGGKATWTPTATLGIRN